MKRYYSSSTCTANFRNHECGRHLMVPWNHDCDRHLMLPWVIYKDKMLLRRSRRRTGRSSRAMYRDKMQLRRRRRRTGGWIRFTSKVSKCDAERCFRNESNPHVSVVQARHCFFKVFIRSDLSALEWLTDMYGA